MREAVKRRTIRKEIIIRCVMRTANASLRSAFCKEIII